MEFSDKIKFVKELLREFNVNIHFLQEFVVIALGDPFLFVPLIKYEGSFDFLEFFPIIHNIQYTSFSFHYDNGFLIMRDKNTGEIYNDYEISL